MEKIALVTGGAHRLGRAFSLCLAQMGYSILLHYHASEEDALRTAEEITDLGVSIRTLRADLTKDEEVHALFSILDETTTMGELRVLVNSAAIMPSAAAAELAAWEWDSTFDLNLRAPFLLAREAARRMSAGGLIVNITDSGAYKAWSRYPAYIVSKAGLESLTRVLARSFAPAVRVNAIAPGLVLPASGVGNAQWDILVNRLPLRRAARVEEITSGLEFLIKNEYITGQTIVVDGGYSLI